MQSFETSYYLDEHIPNLLFFDVCFSLLVGADFLEDIAIVGIFHDQA